MRMQDYISADRYPTLTGLLRRTPWITALAWSQLPSRGAAQMIAPGDLHWDVQRDRKSAAVLRGIIEDGFAEGSRRR